MQTTLRGSGLGALTSWAIATGVFLCVGWGAVPALASGEITPLPAGVRASLLELVESSRIPASLVVSLESDDHVMVFVGLDVEAATGSALRSSMTRSARAARIGEAAGRVLDRVGGDGVEVVARFRSVKAMALRVSADALLRLAAEPLVVTMGADSKGGITLAESGPLVNADVASSEFGVTGDGVTVAVIDTGVDVAHPDLGPAVIAEECFCIPKCCPDGSSRQSGAGAAFDGNGHGTHVSGIVTADGLEAGPGIAPGTAIVGLRVLDDRGFFDSLVGIIQAVEWVADQGGLVDIINMSIGTSQTYRTECDDQDFTFSLLAEAISDVSDQGVVVVAAAGNNASTSRMSAPGCFTDAFSVGAVYDADFGGQSYSGLCSDDTTAADQVACFSNRNDLTDVFAPGAYVRSARVGGGSTVNAGTSMASPVVAGCAALIREAWPGSSRDEVFDLLRDTGATINDSDSGRSYPRVDCHAAVEAAVALAPLCGDANDDGSVLSGDALQALRGAVGLTEDCPLERCDANGSGDLTAADALSILRIAVGIDLKGQCLA